MAADNPWGTLTGRRKRRPLGGRPSHRPLCGQDQIRTKRQCSAAGWWVSHSLTADPAPRMRARSLTSRSIFCLELGLATCSHYGPILRPRVGPPGASTSPIWNRSINVCEIPVKRKTQNVVDVFVPRLFVVVSFLGKRFARNGFRAPPSRATLAASNFI